MKRMYWRPKRVSRTALVLISLGALLGYIVVRQFPSRKREQNYQEKVAASQLAQQSYKIIREERMRRHLTIDSETDIAQTGLVGSLMTPITTNVGALMAKQTSVNPNFAAVFVQYLKDAGLTDGDFVAVGYSGSFPALNIATLAAIQVLKLKAVVISSLSSSQWGANDPDFMWLDMERVLFDAGLLSHRSVAASIGGIEDRGLGLSKRGRNLIQRAIEQHEIAFIEPRDYADSVEQRMRLYRQYAGPNPIRAYINVGGGTVSVGTKQGKRLFKPGLNRSPPAVGVVMDSVMERFVQDGVPVVHVVKIAQLAEQYGFPIQPAITPAVGEGKIFYRERSNKILAAGILCCLLVSLYLFVRSDLGFRLTRGKTRGVGDTRPEQMI